MNGGLELNAFHFELTHDHVGDFAHGLWQNLNPDNKVSLFARVIDLDTGETGDMIFNKYDAVDNDDEDPEEPALLPEELEALAAEKQN